MLSELPKQVLQAVIHVVLLAAKQLVLMVAAVGLIAVKQLQLLMIEVEVIAAQQLQLWLMGNDVGLWEEGLLMFAVKHLER